jgi:hypothetical protein
MVEDGFKFYAKKTDATSAHARTTGFSVPLESLRFASIRLYLDANLSL